MTITAAPWELTAPTRPGSPRLPGGRLSAPLVLAAHGSRDPRSARTVRALARAVGRRWSAPVRAGFLDFDRPSVPAALAAVGSDDRPAVVVPLLLTSAYHGRVDIPEVVRTAGVACVVAPVLGPSAEGEAPSQWLIDALRRRLSELDTPLDALVLAAAGTSYASARSTVETMAAAVGSTMDMACTAGYATTSGPTVGDAVRAMRGRGASRIGVAAYFLAPGRLYDQAVEQAIAAGAAAVARPLGDLDEMVELVLDRVHSGLLAPS